MQTYEKAEHTTHILVTRMRLLKYGSIEMLDFKTKNIKKYRKKQHKLN